MLPAVFLLWQQPPKLQSRWGHSTGKWWAGKQSKLWRSLWGNHHKKKTSKEHKPCCSRGDLNLSDKAMLLMELILRAFQAQFYQEPRPCVHSNLTVSVQSRRNLLLSFHQDLTRNYKTFPEEAFLCFCFNNDSFSYPY